MLANTLGERLALRDAEPVAGGCINAAYRLDCGGARFFLKLNAPSALDMFEAEAHGLRALAGAGVLRVPQPIVCGLAGVHAYLVTEFIELTAADASCEEMLGRQLASLHRLCRVRYGFGRDNFIGASAQPNGESADWVEFWRDRRLGQQLALAAAQGYTGTLQDKGEKLLDALPRLLAGHAPPASLLHGDLWSGNRAADARGAPVLYDPAVYYGDRECDLAMTELFGGFSARFHHAYREAWPLEPGYEARKTLYNLYHVLNHLNLFGGGYARQAEAMMGALLGQRS